MLLGRIIAGGVVVLTLEAIALPTTVLADNFYCSDDTQHRAEIAISNVRNAEGWVAVELYDDNPEGFIKKKGRLQRIRMDANEGAMSLCMAIPSSGRYAIAIFHDENANKRFDRNFIGLPEEGFGFSRNPKIDFGPPDHSEAAFEISDKPISLDIDMIYW